MQAGINENQDDNQWSEFQVRLGGHERRHHMPPNGQTDTKREVASKNQPRYVAIPREVGRGEGG